MGIRKIANELNAMSVPTKHGKTWHFKTVRRILSNPLYTGRIINNKTSTLDFLSGKRADVPQENWIVNHNESYRIVSDTQYAMAQQILLSKKADTHRSC